MLLVRMNPQYLDKAIGGSRHHLPIGLSAAKNVIDIEKETLNINE